MNGVQPGIGAEAGALFEVLLKAGSKPRSAITSLVELADGESVIVGLGQSLMVFWEEKFPD